MKSFISRRGALLIASFVALVIVGCIAIPLGDPEKSKVDPKLIGIWMDKSRDNGAQTMMTVTAYDARTYFVSEFEFTKDKDKKDLNAKDRMDWKMWLTDVGGQQFATLQMITPRLLLNPPDDKDDKDIYAIAKLKLDGDKIQIRTVDDDFIKSASIQNSQQLQELIAKNLDNPKLFGAGDTVEMERIKDAQKDDAGAVLSAFGQGEGIK